jgi:hypothetical protein
MRLRLLVVASLLAVCCTPSAARADATAFLGRNSAGGDRSTVRGFAAGVSLVIVGFEFEYANSTKDETLQVPALRTTSGNVFVQTIGIPAFQLYATTGAGFYRETLGPDEETAFLLNNGGGAKIKLAGPLRVRVDYRIFTLRGNPQHKNVQRIYAGVNLAF